MDHINYDVKKTNLYEQIADNLEQAIMRPEGEAVTRLPSEMELAKRFNVSRTVIREGLKLLKERGLIQLRNGGGSYVTKPSPDTVFSAVSRIIHMEHISNDDLHNMRLILEVAAARQAALHAQPEDMEALDSIIESMKDHSLPLAERVGKDTEFHIILAKASRNVLLGMFVEVMTMLIKEYMGKGVLIPGGIEDALRRHRAVLAAVKTKDPDRAEVAIREHLRVSRQNVRLFEDIESKKPKDAE